jgi:hypothetical protein
MLIMLSLTSIATVTGSFALAATVGLAARVAPPQRAQTAQQTTAPQGEPIAGMSCDAMEGAKMHIHQHLTLLDHGKAVVIPPNVGQVPGRQCLYWVHTHTSDGIVHIESPQMRTFTLGDFFTIWGQPLSRKQAASMKAQKGGSLKVWVNGKPFTGDPRTIQLSAHADVVIEAGPPFPKPPQFTTWGPL